MKIEDIIKRSVPPAEPDILITEALITEMENLEPGSVLTIKPKRLGGRTFVILDREDFEHIAAAGDMGLAERKP